DMYDLLLIRVLFVGLLALCAWFLRPFQLDPIPATAIGAAFGAAVLVFEIRLRELNLKRLIGAAIGSLLGIIGAFLISMVLRQALTDSTTTIPFLQVGTLLLMGYVGLSVGANKGDLLNLAALGGVFGEAKTQKGSSFKILDTSVIIDGRIADILETGFLD